MKLSFDVKDFVGQDIKTVKDKGQSSVNIDHFGSTNNLCISDSFNDLMNSLVGFPNLKVIHLLMTV